MNETDSRTQHSPVEIYDAEQAKQRTQAIAHVKKLWASFAIRHILALIALFSSDFVMAPQPFLIEIVVFACGAAIWFLSWITAIRLGVFVATNNRVLRLWLIYLSWLPGAIVSAEAVFVLELIVRS